jgi:uncharacterized membrane-anchored protein
VPELSERTRLLVAAVTAGLILAVVNLEIAGKERVVREGRTVLLRLAPVDPRSLLQGDYMALRYSMAGEVASAAQAAGVDDGTIVVALDPRGVASFVEIDRGRSFGAGEQRLAFRRRGETVRLAGDAFFFEEGQGERYRGARYGELRVAEDGTAVLVGLRGEDGPLRPDP